MPLPATSSSTVGWRRLPNGAAIEGRERETWELSGEDGTPLSFDVEVTTGKAFDVVGRKWTSLRDVREYAEYLRGTADRLFHGGARLRRVEECPCCGASTASAVAAARVYGIEYRRCARCAHAFVAEQPRAEALAALFGGSEEHSATYTEESAAQWRLDEIVRPKLDWLRRTYLARYGREPSSLLDVGAGGGHFLAVCARDGMRAAGYEVSEPSRRFARRAFGIELRDSDFLEARPGQERFDLVSFWGLLEYTAEPGRFLRSASGWLGRDAGMLVVEVPRFDCLSTVVQRSSDAVARHLDPTSHVNCFSDGSLCVALVRAGFRPVAAWYFGMDAFEMVVQLALRHDDDGLVPSAAPLISAVQAGVDAARWCDDVIVAAVPLEP